MTLYSYSSIYKYKYIYMMTSTFPFPIKSAYIADIIMNGITMAAIVTILIEYNKLQILIIILFFILICKPYLTGSISFLYIGFEVELKSSNETFSDDSNFDDVIDDDDDVFISEEDADEEEVDER